MTHTISIIAPRPRFEVGEVLTHAAAVQPPRLEVLPRLQVVARCLREEGTGLGSWLYNCRYFDIATGRLSDRWAEFCDIELARLPTPEEEAHFQQRITELLDRRLREDLEKHLNHLDARLKAAVNKMKEEAS